MNNKVKAALAAHALFAATLGLTMASLASAQAMVGGTPMCANKDAIGNGFNSGGRTTLVAAVKAARLVNTLQDPGPFTVTNGKGDRAYVTTPDVLQGNGMTLVVDRVLLP